MRVRVRLWAVFGTPEVGLWCDGCQSHARVRQPIALISVHGVTPADPAERCMTCDPREDDDA